MLKNGEFGGSGKFRFGIQGDIENIFGWHDQWSPKTPLSNLERVLWLEHFQTDLNNPRGSEQSSTSKTDQSPKTWLKERANSLKEDRIDRWLKEQKEHPVIVTSEVQALLNQLNVVEEEDKAIFARGRDDDRGNYVSTLYTKEDTNRSRQLDASKRQLRRQLYDVLFLAEVPHGKPGSRDNPHTLVIGDIATIISNTHYLLDKEGVAVGYFSFRGETYRLDKDLTILPADISKTIKPSERELFDSVIIELKTDRKRQ